MQECHSERCRKQHDLGGQNLSYMVDIAAVQLDSAMHRQMQSTLEKYPAVANRTIWDQEEVKFFDEENANLTTAQLDELGIDPSVFNMTTTTLRVATTALREHPELAAELADFRRLASHDNLRYPMDHVIRCFGWVFDRDIFDSSLKIELTHNRKYLARCNIFLICVVSVNIRKPSDSILSLYMSVRKYMCT